MLRDSTSDRRLLSRQALKKVPYPARFGETLGTYQLIAVQGSAVSSASSIGMCKFWAVAIGHGPKVVPHHTGFETTGCYQAQGFVLDVGLGQAPRSQ